jgi:predicted secreted protein
MKADRRSRKMVAVIHCVINHNARDEGWAMYPGINHEVIDILIKHGAGVIQMPCPEMTVLGLPRKRPARDSILKALDTPEGRSRCSELSQSVAETILEFQRNGYTVAAILGGDVESPGCAVPASTSATGIHEQRSGFGIFTKALLDELDRRGIQIPFRGIRDSARETLAEDLQWLDQILASS